MCAAQRRTGRRSGRQLTASLFAFLGLALLLGACGQEDSGPQLARLPSDARILAFGDSLTAGTGATRSADAYPQVLAGLIDREVINVSRPGDTTADALLKLPQALRELNPDLLLLCIGGNDILQKWPQAKTKANIRELIGLAQAQGVQSVLIGVPAPKLFGLSAHPLYAEIATELDLPLEGKALAGILSDADTKSDLIHPNSRGYRVLAEAVAALLKRAGAIP